MNSSDSEENDLVVFAPNHPEDDDDDGTSDAESGQDASARGVELLASGSSHAKEPLMRSKKSRTTSSVRRLAQLVQENDCARCCPAATLACDGCWKRVKENKDNFRLKLGVALCTVGFMIVVLAVIIDGIWLAEHPRPPSSQNGGDDTSDSTGCQGSACSNDTGGEPDEVTPPAPLPEHVVSIPVSAIPWRNHDMLAVVTVLRHIESGRLVTITADSSRQRVDVQEAGALLEDGASLFNAAALRVGHVCNTATVVPTHRAWFHTDIKSFLVFRANEDRVLLLNGDEWEIVFAPQTRFTTSLRDINVAGVCSATRLSEEVHFDRVLPESNFKSREAVQARFDVSFFADTGVHIGADAPLSNGAWVDYLGLQFNSATQQMERSRTPPAPVLLLQSADDVIAPDCSAFEPYPRLEQLCLRLYECDELQPHAVPDGHRWSCACANELASTVETDVLCGAHRATRGEHAYCLAQAWMLARLFDNVPCEVPMNCATDVIPVPIGVSSNGLLLDGSAVTTYTCTGVYKGGVAVYRERLLIPVGHE